MWGQIVPGGVNSLCKSPEVKASLVGSKMGRPESWKWQRMRERLKNQAGKAKMERPLVEQGPGCHTGNVGFWPN